MTTTITHANEQLRDEFLRRVDALFAKVKRWVRDFDPNASIQEDTAEIREAEVGTYRAECLIIERPGYHPVKLIPKARWIFGAEGRVDMVSSLGTESLIYVENDPHISILTLSDSGKILFRDAEPPDDIAEGWVYMQNREIDLYPSLDYELFHRLLEVLSRG